MTAAAIAGVGENIGITVAILNIGGMNNGPDGKALRVSDAQPPTDHP
jgi:hypothetical protein